MSSKWALLCLSCMACNDPDPSPEVCPRGRAAFDLRLTAEGGELPSDTELSVTFSGSLMERYSTGSDSSNNEVLCCAEGDGHGLSLSPGSCGQGMPGPDASVRGDADPTSVVHCQVWSNGAAQVLVQASGYPLVEATLVAKLDERYEDCGIWVTQEVDLELTRGDAAVVRVEP